MVVNTELDDFVAKIDSIISEAHGQLTIDLSRQLINLINVFLYVSHYDLGNTVVDDINLQYFSSFHKYWSKHYNEILDIKINDEQCKKVADALHDVYIRTKGKAFTSLDNKYNVPGLSNREVCLIRFLTANQDFRDSLDFNKIANIYKSNKSIFDISNIIADPNLFLNKLKLTDKSQSDKRKAYVLCLCNYLKSLNSEPYDLLSKYNNNVYNFRTDLTNGRGKGTGYGNKKTDMFIRDMVVSNIWTDVTDFDKIDVASDVNTIKVALRTGIINTAIPLVSSFIDICSYQYSEMDRMNAIAWRRVWDNWREKYPTESISSPCLIDYFIYFVVGKQYCQESLYEYKCNEYGHTFMWDTPQKHNCQVCSTNKKKNQATKIGKYLPCMQEEGFIVIQKTNFFKSNVASPNYDVCPFVNICKSQNTQKLQPPKSISIIGKTGWKSSYSYENQGGGGPMA